MVWLDFPIDDPVDVNMKRRYIYVAISRHYSGFDQLSFYSEPISDVEVGLITTSEGHEVTERVKGHETISASGSHKPLKFTSNFEEYSQWLLLGTSTINNPKCLSSWTQVLSMSRWSRRLTLGEWR